MTLDQIKQEALCDEYINRITTKILEKKQHTTEIFSTSDDVLLSENASWFLPHCRNVFGKNFMLAIQGVIGLKVWCVALSIDQTWTKILKTRSNYAKNVPRLLRHLLLNSTPGQRQTFHGQYRPVPSAV